MEEEQSEQSFIRKSFPFLPPPPSLPETEIYVFSSCTRGISATVFFGLPFYCLRRHNLVKISQTL